MRRDPGAGGGPDGEVELVDVDPAHSKYRFNTASSPRPLSKEWLAAHQGASSVHVSRLEELPVSKTFAGGRHNEVVLRENIVVYSAGGDLYSTMQAPAPSRLRPSTRGVEPLLHGSTG